MKSILDPSFRYTNAASTDIRRTFAKIRREMQKRESTLLPKASVAQLKRKA